MIEKVLLSGDVDAIKEFVFETSYLPQIRGGSQLLIKCEEEVKSLVEQAEGNEIYCGGGSFLFEVPIGHKKEIEQAITDIYSRNTSVATITLAFEQEVFPHDDYSPSDGWASRIYRASMAQKTAKDSFGLRTSLLGAEVRGAKTQKTIAPFMEAVPFAMRCNCCGKRMASGEVPLKKYGETEPSEILRVCRVCHRKHDAGKSGKSGTRGKFNEEFHQFIMAQIRGLQSMQPRDLDDLVRGAKRNFLALLYADGNNIGSLLNQANSKEEYRAISIALSEGTKSSLFKALFSVCGHALKGKDPWPFEVINIGGDDVTLLVQAGYAWDVAVQFLENFEKDVLQHLKKNLKKLPEGWERITAACGISIADERYPMRYLQRLAEGSLKRAKKKSKENVHKPNSAIDFLWLPNPVISERSEPIAGYYQREDRSLTARPYTLDEAKEILDLAMKALKLPSSQRNLWGEALDRGIYASRNAIYYNVARMSNEKKRKFTEEFLTEVTTIVARDDWQDPYSLWVPRKGDSKNLWCTALLDVLELAELISMCRDIGKEGLSHELPIC